MLQRSIASVSFLALILISACSTEAAAVTPVIPAATPTPSAVVAEPTASPEATSERDAVINYLSSLTDISSDYSASLEDAAVSVFTLVDADGPRLLVNGSAQSLGTVFSGFSNRIDRLQPSPNHLKLVALHALIRQTIERDSDWLDEYQVAVLAGDSASLSSIEKSYYPLNQSPSGLTSVIALLTCWRPTTFRPLT